VRDKRWARASARIMTALLATGIALLGTPRFVAATTTGSGSVDITLTMQVFPCFSGGCPGSATGTGGLSLSGLGTATTSGVPVPFTAVWPPEVSSVSASFTYQDTCELGQPDGTVPLSGGGVGGFTLSGGTVVLGGGTVSAATLSGTINFSRIANAVVMSLSALSITPPAGSPVIAVNLNSGALVGQAAAGLVWTNGPGSCGANGQVMNQTAMLAGIVLQPA